MFGEVEVAISKEVLDDLYNRQGLSLAKIAKRLDCSPSAVHKWMKKYDLARRPQHGWNKTKSEAAAQIAARHGVSKELLDDLYTQQGLTLKEIGAQLGVSDGTILYWMKIYDLTRRDRSRAIRSHAIDEAAFDPPLTDEQAY
jgi:transposase